MPTGYTYGILDGKVKTFPEFAKLCMKAFGACIHMRDDNMDKPYSPCKPSNYDLKALRKAEFELENVKTLSDEEIKTNHTTYLQGRLKEIKKQIIKREKDKVILKNFLFEAKNYTPPTKDHTEIAKFMIEQLQSTLAYDGDSSYDEKELLDVIKQLNNIDVSKIRRELFASVTQDIIYHTKVHKEEVDRCKERNKWVRDFIKSLK